jgi:septal ring-binding cell division protein DamX
MFFSARPISLNNEVWDRIKAYLDTYAAQHPGFLPNTSAFLEQAAVAFLDAEDAKANPPAEEMSIDDTSTEEPAAYESTEDSGDEAVEVEEEVVEVVEEEPAEEEEVKPARKSAKKAAKKSSKKSAKKRRK